MAMKPGAATFPAYHFPAWVTCFVSLLSLLLGMTTGLPLSRRGKRRVSAQPPQFGVELFDAATRVAASLTRSMLS
jgi:hypothetical protein